MFKGMKITIAVGIAVVIIYFFFVIFSRIFICNPVRAYWDITITNRKCLPLYPLYYGNISVNIFTDFVLLFLPMPLIWRLRVPRKQKICVILVMSLGFITCTVSTLRLYAFITTSDSKDPSWDQAIGAYLSAMELNLGIICACLPVLKPLVSRFAPGLISSSKHPHPTGYTSQIFPSSFNRVQPEQLAPDDNNFVMLHLGRNNQSQETCASIIDEQDSEVSGSRSKSPPANSKRWFGN